MPFKLFDYTSLHFATLFVLLCLKERSRETTPMKGEQVKQGKDLKDLSLAHHGVIPQN